MSEENEEHSPFQALAAIFSGPSKEQIEQHKMATQVSNHEIREFFDSLTKQQLEKLSGLISALASADDSAIAYYYLGVASTFLDLKHKSCIACGVDHDETLSKMSEPETKSDPELPARGTPEYTSLLVMYELQHLDKDDTLYCVNCKAVYPSLQDRMLRRPGKAGCESCIQKEKWG